MKFKLHIVREGRAATEDMKEVLADEKDLEICAPSCSEAVVVANKQHPDYLVTKWEEISEEAPGEKPKHVKLARESFKSETEWKSAQIDMDSMEFSAGLKLAEARKWKVEKEDK